MKLCIHISNTENVIDQEHEYILLFYSIYFISFVFSPLGSFMSSANEKVVAAHLVLLKENFWCVFSLVPRHCLSHVA